MCAVSVPLLNLHKGNIADYCETQSHRGGRTAVSSFLAGNPSEIRSKIAINF